MKTVKKQAARSHNTGHGATLVKSTLNNPDSSPASRGGEAMSKSRPFFNIGEAARESGISAKMIRHYEQVGLLKEAARTDAGYRLYSQRDLHVLRFIRHSRDLGFSIRQIEDLLGLWLNESRPSREVKKLAQNHLQALDEKIRELNLMKSELERLVSCCKGDSRPDCPILDGLAN
jgi:Cu(I)-responsive transcriptional regulator